MNELISVFDIGSEKCISCCDAHPVPVEHYDDSYNNEVGDPRGGLGGVITAAAVHHGLAIDHVAEDYQKQQLHYDRDNIQKVSAWQHGTLGLRLVEQPPEVVVAAKDYWSGTHTVKYNP